MTYLSKLYCLQFHPLYKLESDQWIRKIKSIGIEAFLLQSEGLARYLESKLNLIEKYDQEFADWLSNESRESPRRILTCLDLDYPRAFYFIKNPPLLLFVKGHCSMNDFKFISVVGSRDIRPYTSDWLELHLVDFLKSYNVGICSGGARGVDIKAHQICVRLKRPTLVFLPSGLEQTYPPELKIWEQAVLNHGGAFLSEYSPQTELRKHFFHCRNRLISALGLFTVVVQAERRSGSLITAKHSIEQGKALGVIPGHPYDSQFSGNLFLIREGAVPIIDASDLSVLYNSESL